MTGEHFEQGRARMVDVGDKDASQRDAVAEAVVRVPDEAASRLRDTPKGDPLRVAELAGIMASKRAADLIPLCHPLPLDATEVRAEWDDGTIHITARCRTYARTGVEMEAMTAASVAALTVYDMLKGHSKAVVIQRVRLVSKEGGVSGRWSTPDR